VGESESPEKVAEKDNFAEPENFFKISRK